MSCNQDNKVKPDNKNGQLISNDWNPYSSLLLGQWSICSTVSEDGWTTQYNVCPKIIFNSNGTADLSVGESIKWKVEKDTLYISPFSIVNKDFSSFFADFKYLIVKSEDITSIQIQQIEKKYFYNLSKQKAGLYPNLPDLQGKNK